MGAKKNTVFFSAYLHNTRCFTYLRTRDSRIKTFRNVIRKRSCHLLTVIIIRSDMSNYLQIVKYLLNCRAYYMYDVIVLQPHTGGI